MYERVKDLMRINDRCFIEHRIFMPTCSSVISISNVRVAFKKKICRLFSPTLMYILDFIDIITTIIHLLASLNILNIEVLSSFIRFSRRHIHIHLFFFLYSSIFLLCSVHFVLSDSLKYNTLRQSVPFRLA